MFSLFSQCASCVSFSSWFMLSWLLYIFCSCLSGLAEGCFRVFCAESLMLLLLSLVDFWFDIFFCNPLFIEFITGSASLISVSLSLSSIFLFIFIFIYSEVIRALFFHYFSLFVTFFSLSHWILCRWRAHCQDLRLVSLLGWEVLTAQRFTVKSH